METVLYADVLFLVNFAMDFISLSAAASLGARHKSPVKISIAASLGALYAISATIAHMPPPLDLVLAILVGAAMCALAFGFGGIIPFIRQYLIFWCCSALLGGVMTALLSLGGPSPTATLPTIIAGALFTFFLIGAIRARAGCSSLFITVTHDGKSASFEALCDSGNLLRDPFSSAPVIVASHEALRGILPQSTILAMLSCDVEELNTRLRLRLIPAGTADGGSVLCAFFPDSVTVKNGKRIAEKQCLIAISPHHKAYFAGHAATCPSILIP